MQVQLVGVTMPVIPGVQTSQELLAYCARVSSAANQLNHSTGWRLLRRLLRFKEWSPLEMVSVTVEIETTRDIARQILRHRSFSFQEFSQRYAQASEVATFREARMQHPTDRQSSLPCDDIDTIRDWTRHQRDVWTLCQAAYQWALSRGIAKEVARVVLPEGMTESRLYMAGTLRSWVHYIELRSKPSTQKEHREIAMAIADLLEEQYPDLFTAMKELAA